MTRSASFFAALDSTLDVAVHLFCALFALLRVTEASVMLSGRAWLLLLLLSLGATLFDTLLGVYERDTYRRARAAFSAILRAQGLTRLCLPLLLLGWRGALSEGAVRWTLLLLLSDGGAMLCKRAIFLTVRRALGRSSARGSLLLVGDNPRAALRFAKATREHPEEGYRILGFVGDALCEEALALPRLGRDAELSRVLDEHRPHAVAFAIQSDSDPRFREAVSLCDDRVIAVYLLPIVHEYFKTPRQIVPLCGESAIRLHYTPLEERWARVVKRCEDFLLGTLLLLLALPWMGGIALTIRLLDGRPILFRQKRVGYRGREFTILKFRTMRDSPERDSAMTARADPRRTPLGRLLRTSSLDELPQLINVVRGEMSLVGPRPEIPALVARFKQTIPLYMLKHSAKPGITGRAQIRGLRGDTSIEERIREDLSYMAEWTPLLDLKILALTPFRLFNRQERKASPTEARKENRGLRVLYAASTEEHLRRFHTPYLRFLEDEGCRVFTLSGGEGSDFTVPFSKRFFSLKNLIATLRCRRILKTCRAELLILNTTLASAVLRLALPRKRRCTVIHFVHGYLFHTPPKGLQERILLYLERHLKEKTDLVLVMNEEDRQIATRYGLAKTIRFTYGCGVTRPKMPIARYPAPHKRQRDDEPFTLAFVGELSKRKNQAFLLRALAVLRKSLPGARLCLVGDGKEKRRLLRLSRRLGIAPHVRVLGALERPWEALAKVDLYVSAARFEGLPFNVLEAALLGYPILVSDIKGHREIVEKIPCGALYTPGSISDFVNHCLYFYYKPPHIDPTEASIALAPYELGNAKNSLFTLFREVINACQFKKEPKPFSQDGSTR